MMKVSLCSILHNYPAYPRVVASHLQMIVGCELSGTRMKTSMKKKKKRKKEKKKKRKEKRKHTSKTEQINDNLYSELVFPGGMGRRDTEQSCMG